MLSSRKMYQVELLNRTKYNPLKGGATGCFLSLFFHLFFYSKNEKLFIEHYFLTLCINAIIMSSSAHRYLLLFSTGRHSWEIKTKIQNSTRPNWWAAEDIKHLGKSNKIYFANLDLSWKCSSTFIWASAYHLKLFMSRISIKFSLKFEALWEGHKNFWNHQCGDFTKLCGLLRVSELYIAQSFESWNQIKILKMNEWIYQWKIF